MLHRLGDYPSVFSGVRTVMGGDRYRRRFVAEHIGRSLDTRVLDLGCGPASVARLLGGAAYVGIDINSRYIKYAVAHSRSNARYICADVTRSSLRELGQFDVVLAMGLLHHLSDVAVEGLLGNIIPILTPGGRFITIDSVRTEAMAPSARWLMNRDRGDFVRTAERYHALAAEHFEVTRMSIYEDLLRVPFTHAAYPLLAMSLSASVATDRQECVWGQERVSAVGQLSAV